MTDYVCHTSPVENAIKILECGKLLSPVLARKMSAAELQKEGRNAANDPEDYFDYITHDCYWWVPGKLNDQYDSDDADIIAMVDFMFWDTGLELLFQEVIPTFDALRINCLRKSSGEQSDRLQKKRAVSGGDVYLKLTIGPKEFSNVLIILR